MSDRMYSADRALPGVCDHVPYVLDAAAVDAVAAAVESSGLRVRSINGDIGDLNHPLDAEARAARDRHLDMLRRPPGRVGYF